MQKFIFNFRTKVQNVPSKKEGIIWSSNDQRFIKKQSFYQPFSLNSLRNPFLMTKKSDDFELIENSVNDRFFFKKISHQLPNKNEKDSTNELSSNEQNKFLFRHQDKL